MYKNLVYLLIFISCFLSIITILYGIGIFYVIYFNMDLLKNDYNFKIGIILISVSFMMSVIFIIIILLIIRYVYLIYTKSKIYVQEMDPTPYIED